MLEENWTGEEEKSRTEKMKKGDAPPPKQLSQAVTSKKTINLDQSANGKVKVRASAEGPMDKLIDKAWHKKSEENQ